MQRPPRCCLHPPSLPAPSLLHPCMHSPSVGGACFVMPRVRGSRQDAGQFSHKPTSHSLFSASPRETFRRRFSPTVPRARQSVPLHDGGRVKLFPVRPSVLACIPPPSLPAFPPFVWHGEFRHMPSATDSFRWTETRRTSSLQITARHSCQRFKSRLQRSMDFKPFGNATCPSNVKAPMIPDSAKSE